MKKIALTIVLCIIAQPAFAILSPLYQSLEEIKAIVTSPEIEKQIPQGQSIISIKRDEIGFVLKTDELKMRVDIQYSPTKYPGPKQFTLVFHPPVNR
jgi:hypothetical protein